MSGEPAEGLQLVSVREAAEMLGVSERSVRDLCARGSLRAWNRPGGQGQRPQWWIAADDVAERLAEQGVGRRGRVHAARAGAEAFAGDVSSEYAEHEDIKNEARATTPGASEVRASTPWPAVEGGWDDQLPFLEVELARQERRHKMLVAMLRAQARRFGVPVSWGEETAPPARFAAIDDAVSRLTALIRWHEQQADEVAAAIDETFCEVFGRNDRAHDR